MSCFSSCLISPVNCYTIAQVEIWFGGCEKLFSLKHKDVNFENGLTDDGSLERNVDEIKCLGEEDSARVIPHSASTVVSNGD
jgi:hypothetical protein